MLGLSDEKVLAGIHLYSLNERKNQVQWLKYLSEVEERRLYALAGYESLFSFVHRGLKYSEGSVGKRIQVARTARKFPVLYSMIFESKITLAVVSRLSPHLTEMNYRSLLEKAQGLSVRETEVLVAGLKPLPEVKDSVRAVSGTASSQQELATTPVSTSLSAKAPPIRRND